MAKEILEIRTLNVLVKLINQEIENGVAAVQQYTDSTKVVTYWKIGYYIKVHLDYKRNAAQYGAAFFPELAKELGLGVRTLYQALQFYESYPKILNEPRAECFWTHYKLLLRIKDLEVREIYYQKVLEKGLSSVQLEQMLKKAGLINARITSKEGILEENRGKLCISRLKVLVPGDSLHIDHGFHIYSALPAGKVVFSADDFVELSERRGEYSVEKVLDSNPKDLNNYLAYVKQYVDGDTLWVNIALGFGLVTCQKVRLRGINAPDIISELGVKAADFIRNRLAKCEFILLKSYWWDKFSRYLVNPNVVLKL